MRQLIAGICVALTLAGCASLGLNAPPPPAARTLDDLSDDLGSLLIAYDLPRGIAPAEAAPQDLALDVAGATPSHVKVTLVQADVDDIPPTLPPPATGRAYYFFAIAKKDQPTLHGAQQAARSGNVASADVTVTLTPRLCRSETIDPKQVTVSVQVVLPGSTPIAPLIDHRALADILAPAGAASLPPCG